MVWFLLTDRACVRVFVSVNVEIFIVDSAIQSAFIFKLRVASQQSGINRDP